MNLIEKLPKDLRKSLHDTSKEFVERLEQEIPSYRDQLAYTVNKNVTNEVIYHFANVPLLIRLSMFDLSIIFYYFIKAEKETEQNLFARLMCSQLYEYIEDIPRILGKKFRKVITDLNNPALIQELKSNIQELNQLKQKHHIFLKNIRNNVSSHKDHDGNLQAKIILQLDLAEAACTYMEIAQTYISYYRFEKSILKQLKARKNGT